jgi:sarcosine oxidase
MIGEADIGVVGAGIVGLCTAFALRERGASVRIYESGFAGRGQSAGETRIFRHAHDDPRLVAFAQESRTLWEEWAGRLGVELLSDDGAVVLGPAVQRRLALLEDAGVPARAIGPSELSECLPQLARYEGPALLDEAGGALRVRAAIAALTAELGDDLVTDEVISVRPTGWGTVEVRGVGTRAEHAKVVVCAGRGTARLARGAGLDLPLRFGAAARVTFDVVDHSEQLACLQDGSDAFGEVGAYASAMPGNRRYAVGLGEPVGVRDDGSLLDPSHLAAVANRTSAYVERALPGLAPQPVEYVHCWVTELPWSADAVAVWEAGDLLFVAGNHLFKHAPALGRATAGAATGDRLPDLLRPEATVGAPQG